MDFEIESWTEIELDVEIYYLCLQPKSSPESSPRSSPETRVNPPGNEATRGWARDYRTCTRAQIFMARLEQVLGIELSK